jgi:hypothetical protein
VQQVNQINTAAFAAEHATAVQENIDRAAQVQDVDIPELAIIRSLAKQLGNDCGVPQPAAALLATRIVKLECEVAKLRVIRQPGHIQDVERRGY